MNKRNNNNYLKSKGNKTIKNSWIVDLEKK